MAPLVARAAAAAASLPSGRAGLLGSGRLPLGPARRGHGALVLAGRRVRAGHGGVLAVQFMAPALARDVKVACHPPGIYPKTVINDDEDDEFERIYIEFIQKVERLHASGELLIGLPLPPAAVSDEEKAVQEKLKEIAEGCIGLHADAMRCLRLKERLRMYPEAMLTLLGRLYTATKYDIDAMISVAPRACVRHAIGLVFVVGTGVDRPEFYLGFYSALVRFLVAVSLDSK
ncbi:hypothetical protein PVAP13_5KG491800 [Panicum virgatum]|uniref:Uncharacterized protein n=1 Tax=Panicum virgatum TaxID=38727 RepID=A0A8T0SSJ8_PANVG|nr:hypothetical protein PVAP13_5KG491800 [Panicum virgatum]